MVSLTFHPHPTAPPPVWPSKLAYIRDHEIRRRRRRLVHLRLLAPATALTPPQATLHARASGTLRPNLSVYRLCTQTAEASLSGAMTSLNSHTVTSIVATYRALIASDPDLTKPVAAIQSLVALLNAVPTTTVYETLEMLKEHADRLKASVSNPVPLTAGTDLFKQYFALALKEHDESFDAVRQHLARNDRLFVERAAAARVGVVEAGWRFVGEAKCVLTHGASRSVTALLRRAAEGLGPAFRVVYVRDETRPCDGDAIVAQLRRLSIPVAEIPGSAVAHVMGLLRSVHMVFVGAEAITSNGGIISRIGTLQIAQLASKARIPFYVAAETHKFSRKLPLDQRDLGFEQRVLNFSNDAAIEQPQDAVDYTVRLASFSPRTDPLRRTADAETSLPSSSPTW